MGELATAVETSVLAKPCMPASLRKLVDRVPALTVGSTLPGWKVPRSVSSQTRTEAAEALSSYHAWLAPAGREAVLQCIMVLLAHYYMPSHDEGVQQRVAGDWADDLAGYPLWAVQAACDDWRHTNDWRPSPTQIITRCADLVFEERKVVARLEKLAEAPEGADETERGFERPKPGHQQRVSDLVAGCIKTMATVEPKGKRMDVGRRKPPPVSWEEERRRNRAALNTDTMKAAIAREGVEP